MVFANTCDFYIGSLTDDRFVALYQHFIMTAKPRRTRFATGTTSRLKHQE
jgi:hypothetical protein